MGKKITLKVDFTVLKGIQERAEELRQDKVAALERNGWSEQARKLDSALEEMSEAEYIRHLVREDLREHGKQVE